MLQYQLNHGAAGWLTQNRITPEGAEKIRALMSERNRPEGNAWRIFDPANVPTDAVEAVKPPKPARAPRKATRAAEGTTTARKRAAAKPAADKPAAEGKATRTRAPRKATRAAAEGSE